MNIQPYLDYTEQLFEVYRQLELKSLDDFNGEGESKWKGKNFITYFVDVTRSVPPLEAFDKSDFKMYDEFVTLSGDIKFCAGMLHYLYPHISKKHDELTSNMIDRRYIMHISWGYQSIYQFWDRIGDLLWHFFKTGLDREYIYTGRVLNNLEGKYKLTEIYISLKDKFDSFKEFFDIRHDVVHSFTLGTELYWKRTEHFKNRLEQQKLLELMLTYRDKITKSLPDCIDALELALELITELKGDVTNPVVTE